MIPEFIRGTMMVMDGMGMDDPTTGNGPPARTRDRGGSAHQSDTRSVYGMVAFLIWFIGVSCVAVMTYVIIIVWNLTPLPLIIPVIGAAVSATWIWTLRVSGDRA